MEMAGIVKSSPLLPEIDVIIPFHIIHEYLPQAIESVLDSKGVAVQVLLVDDSDAEIPIWLKRFEALKNVKLLKNFNKGYLGALEIGIKQSTSEYIGFLDSDDLTQQTRLRDQIQFMSENELDISSSRLIRVDHKGNKLAGEGLLGSQFSDLVPKFRLLLGAYGADSSLVAKRHILQSNWDNHRKYPAQFADYAFLLNLIPNVNYGHFPNASYYYRSHKSQMSREKALLDDWEKVFPLWIKHLNFLKQDLPNTGILEVNSRVAAAIAFPSLLPNLNSNEIKKLKIWIKNFLLEINQTQNVTRKDKVALSLRLLIASRGKEISSWPYAPHLFWRYIKILISGMVPRRN